MNKIEIPTEGNDNEIENLPEPWNSLFVILDRPPVFWESKSSETTEFYLSLLKNNRLKHLCYVRINDLKYPNVDPYLYDLYEGELVEGEDNQIKFIDRSHYRPEALNFQDTLNLVKELNEEDEEDTLLKDVIKEIIKKFGNHKYKYKLVAEYYTRGEPTEPYTIKFTAPNDYLALFSMYIHASPTIDNLEERFDGEGLKELFEKYPTYEAMYKYASECWWGDGDDFILSLENLTTGKSLHRGDDDFPNGDGYDGCDEDTVTYTIEEAFKDLNSKQYN